MDNPENQMYCVHCGQAIQPDADYWKDPCNKKLLEAAKRREKEVRQLIEDIESGRETRFVTRDITDDESCDYAAAHKEEQKYPTGRGYATEEKDYENGFKQRKSKTIARKYERQPDSLDLALSANYRHDLEIFPEKFHVYLQPRTIWETKKKLPEKETKKKLPEKETKKKSLKEGQEKSYCKVIRGGVVQRLHPMSVKLAIPSPHSPQTTAGFSRKSDGSFFV